ncbi:MAG: vanadium-dependent haloperoxidase [Chromatiales bacterium]
MATAARRTLNALYPAQASVFDDEYDDYLDAITNGSKKRRGVRVGAFVAKKLLKARKKDGSKIDPPYVPSGEPGIHDVDPLNPGQGFLNPGWGDVTPFALDDSFSFTALPPPALGSLEYAVAFNDVKDLGSITSTTRTDEQTEIGLYWAYDGARGLGTPPRLYNQIARVIADQEGNTEAENARLFALINIAQADAGILCWGIKYTFNFWRPILGIRRADEDGNVGTDQDATWTPLGAPNSNNPAEDGGDFTPPFPAYTSGHATFGASVFRTLERFYGTDTIDFTVVSDELNGVTKDSFGNVRPFSPRSFSSFSGAAEENARSRIYLGIHWQFDADEGVASGNAVADHVFDTVLQPLP